MPGSRDETYRRLASGGTPAASETGSGRMTERRRDKLMAIKEREELKDALLNDIKSRFKSRLSEQKINKEVDTFVATAGLSLSNLDRLQRRLQKREGRPSAMKSLGPDDDALSVLTGISAYSAPRSLKLGNEDPTQAEVDAALNAPLGVVGTSGISEQKKPDAIPEDSAAPGLREDDLESELEPLDWSKLDEYASILHSQDAFRVKLHGEEMKHKLRLDLDQQVADSRLRKQRQREAELKFCQEQEVETEKWKEAEETKAANRRQKQADERAKREEMLMETERKKREEREAKINEDKAMLLKISKELDKERNTIVVKKAQAQAKHKKTEEERIQQQIAKDELKQKQMEEDLRMMREYQEILLQQERKREEDLRKRTEAQAERQRQLEKTTSAKADKDNADQERVQREREEIQRRALETDRDKAARRKRLTDETQAFLFKQMEEKSNIATRNREAKMEAARLLEMDTQDFADIEKQRADERRARNVAHRQELERQIALRNKPFPGCGTKKTSVDGSDYVMSETEMRMNKRLIKQVKNTLKEAHDAASGYAASNNPGSP